MTKLTHYNYVIYVCIYIYVLDGIGMDGHWNGRPKLHVIVMFGFQASKNYVQLQPKYDKFYLDYSLLFRLFTFI